MITREERESLWLPPECGIGWYCDGQVIMPEDTFEVVEEEKERKGDPQYAFCSKGKQGTAKYLVGSWIVGAEFPTDNGPQTVGCADFHLRKL